jgi:hypothetical protein
VILAGAAFVVLFETATALSCLEGAWRMWVHCDGDAEPERPASSRA